MSYIQDILMTIGVLVNLLVLTTLYKRRRSLKSSYYSITASHLITSSLSCVGILILDSVLNVVKCKFHSKIALISFYRSRRNPKLWRISKLHRDPSSSLRHLAIRPARTASLGTCCHYNKPRSFCSPSHVGSTALEAMAYRTVRLF